MAFKRVLIPALLEQEGLFARKSSSNILSDPRILEHLRHVAQEAQLEDENEDNESDDSELEHQKQELTERITAYNNRNQGGAFRVTQNDLDYEGALRFYFEAGNERLAKALRLNNKTDTKELLPRLISKFNLLKDVSHCVLYVVHEADEIALDSSDCPLEIAINAVNIPRFVLRLRNAIDLKEESLEIKFLNLSTKTNTDKSNLSQAREHQIFHMNENENKENDKSVTIAPAVATEPHASVTSPTKVKKANRTKSFIQMVRKKKGADTTENTELSTYRFAPGILKVYGDHVSPGSNYKSVRVSTISTAKEVVKHALEKYAIEDSIPSKFVLCDVVGHFKVDKEEKEERDYEEAQWVTEYTRVVNDNERPLAIQSLWKPAAGRLRRFELKEKSHLEVSCFFINTAENLRKTSSLSSPTIDSERSSILSEQAANESVVHENMNSDSKAESDYATNGQLQSYTKRIPFLLLIKGYNSTLDKLVYPLEKPQILVRNAPSEAGSKIPSICLSAPDISEAHCHIYKKIDQRRGAYDTNIDEVQVSVFIEPISSAYVDINGVKIEQLTMLVPGQLVSFGHEYCFVFKDPSQIEEKALRLTWLDSLKQSILQAQKSRLPAGRNDSFHKDNDDGIDFDYDISNSPSKKVKRSYVMLTYEYQHEDELLDNIVHTLDVKSFKLTPSYLLVMMVEHSCASFDDIHVRKFLLKVSSALQSIAWEKTNDIGKNSAERKGNVGEFFDDMLQDLAPVVTWMANSLEMLHFLQCNLTDLMQSVRSSKSAVRDSLISAYEELLTVLEEVIMFTFQQTVYHLTKVLYSSLPAILDANPFQSEDGDEDEETTSTPPGVSFVISIYRKVLGLVQAHMVHPHIITQLFEYLFFFTNASLFNSLMERGAGGKFYRWTKGVQIRGNLDVLEEFANRNGLQDQFSAHMKKIVAAIALLSIPKAQLNSMDWLTIREEFPDLNASQVQQLLGEYQLNGKTRPRGWYPPPEEVEAALRTSDVLESFATHPPLLLPSTNFQLDLNKSPNDQEFAKCLLQLHHAYGNSKGSSRDAPPSSNSKARVAAHTAKDSIKDIESSKGMVGDQLKMTSTPITNSMRGSRDDVRFNDSSMASQLIVDFKEKNESLDKMDTNRNQKHFSDANPKITISSSDNDQVSENAPKVPNVGNPISNDIKNGNINIIKSNELLAESGKEKDRTSSDADDVDVCDVDANDVDIHDVDFTSSQAQLSEKLAKNSHDVSVVELVRGDKGLGLGLIDGLITPLASPGIYIRTIVANSPAAKDGRIRLGDRILAVNGKSLVGCDYSRAMEMIIHSGGELSFLIAKSDRITIEKVLSSQC